MKPGQPANYLMLGSDVRPANETPEEKAAYGSTADAAGQRSDVMMILHVDPAGKTGQSGVVPARHDGEHSRLREEEVECGVFARRPLARDQDARGRLRAPADQPLPRGRLPRLQERRQRDRPHQAVLPDSRARSVHRSRRRNERVRQPQRRPGARLRAFTGVLHPRRPAEPGAVAVELHDLQGRSGLAQRPAAGPPPHSPPAVLPADA